MTRTRALCGLAVLLACAGAVLGTFLDESALRELAELEGYQMTAQEVLRARTRTRRDALDTECRCPPSSSDEDMPPPPPPSSGGMRPHFHPDCMPFPPPYMPHRMKFNDYQDSSCELRPLFRIPEKFNFSARVHCFDQWERPTAEEYGISPEARRDSGKYKPWQRHPLLWNKGCDMQCHFAELDLLSGEGKDVAIDAGAVAGLLNEDGDSSDISMAIASAVRTCMDSNAELVHAKQACRSGADEMLFCLQRTLEETCPGVKWQGQRSCSETADVSAKLRVCSRMRHMMHPPPPPPHMFRRMYWRAPAPQSTPAGQDLGSDEALVPRRDQ